MARIIGNTTATPTPVSDWDQTDQKKADYIKNKPVIGKAVYTQADEPIDAPEGSLWVDMDAEMAEESFIELDTTLSQEGMAADAKAVGDALSLKADASAIPSIDGLASEKYVEDAISQIPTPDVSGQIDAHNTNGDAHSDIRTAISNLTASDVGALPSSGGTLSGEIVIDPASISNEPTGTSALRILQSGMWDVEDLVDMATFSVFPQSPFGLKFKADGNGQSYIQSQRINSDTEMFPLLLNPYGGKVFVNGVEIATKNDIPTVPTKTEALTYHYEDGSTRTVEVYVK